MVSLGTDGRIASQGSLSSALSKNKKLAHKAKAEMEEADKDQTVVDQPEAEGEGAKKSDGKLIVAEEIQEGHVSWQARAYYTHIE